MQDRRLREIDARGIEMMLSSLNASAVQAKPGRRQAIEIAQRADDLLAEEVQKRPDRFQGLAALPMQDPDAATRELVRWPTSSARWTTLPTPPTTTRRNTVRSGQKPSGCA